MTTYVLYKARPGTEDRFITHGVSKSVILVETNVSLYYVQLFKHVAKRDSAYSNRIILIIMCTPKTIATKHPF